MYAENLFEQILEQPDAPKLLQEVQRRLNDEQIKRQKFYNDIDESMKAEFINGEIIVHSPVRRDHNEANGLLYKLVDTFVRKNQLGFVGFEKIMVQFTRNDYEPDIVFFNSEKAANFTSEQTLFPVPDFIVEILSKSTEDKDRGIKKQDYQSHGVLEYWLVNPKSKSVEQFILTNGVYELHLKASDGKIISVAIAGFSIPIQVIFDEKINFEAMQNLMTA